MIAPLCLCGDETGVGIGVTAGVDVSVEVRDGLGVAPVVSHFVRCHEPSGMSTH